MLLAGQLSAQRDTIYGDLTADGVPEMLVLVHYTPPVEDTLNGTTTLATATLYRRINGEWDHWPAARGFLMHAYEEAGMERFYPRIERGALVLVHGHTGYTNWETTRRFRYQRNRFELIGYTFSLSERCARQELFDYNLSTGRYTYDEKEWNCDATEDDYDGFRPTVSRTGTLPPPRSYLLTEERDLDFSPPRAEDD